MLNNNNTDSSATLLSRMRLRADPLADATIAAILADWDPAIQPGSAAFAAQWQSQSDKLAAVSRAMVTWTDNQSVQHWQDQSGKLSPAVAAALTHYLNAAQVLPTWADRAKIERAQALFGDHGFLPVTLLFCASLPECYVLPDLSAVLQTSGQLVNHTDYRIRATGAMIFPVMMKGGLSAADGAGLAQTFKVRLIHATIRWSRIRVVR